MKIKICIAYILVLIVMGTLCGCGTSTNETEALFEELDVDYTANDDGTYTYKGDIYKYKREVSGIEGESPVTFIILTNDTETSFEDISYSLKKAEISTGIPEFVVLGWHSLTPEHGDTEEAETQIRLDEDFQRIESYTKKYFSDLNAIEFSEEDVLVELQEKDGKIEVSVVYFYTAPSVPFKEEVYRWSLGHAFNVLSFFPEVSRFDYTVKYPYAEGAVMYLTIDEAKINTKGKDSLEDIWFGCSMNERSGFDTFYWKAFSSIVETEESKTWRDQPVTDLNSPVP